MKNVVKALIAAIGLSACVAPQNNSLSVLPAYNIKQQHATVRVEASPEPAERIKLYSFIDADATKEKPVDFENMYGEVRLSYSLGGLAEVLTSLSAAAEYNGGNGLDDTVRFGPMFGKELWKGNFTAAKFFPVEVTEEKGMQVCFYVSQDIGDRVTASLLGEYNLKPKELYGEAEVGVKITDNISAVGQARILVPHKGSDTDVAPVVGVKYGF